MYLLYMYMRTCIGIHMNIYNIHILTMHNVTACIHMLLCLSTGAGGSGDPQAALARAAAASGIPYGAHLPPGFPGAAGHPPGLNIPTSSAGGAGGGGEMPAHIMAALAARPDMDPRELLSMQHVSAALMTQISLYPAGRKFPSELKFRFSFR